MTANQALPQVIEFPAQPERPAISAIFTDRNAQDFLGSLDVSQASRIVYARALKQIFSYFLDNGITSPSKADVIKYKDHLKKSRAISPNTGQRYMSTARQFFSWCEIEEITPKNIAQGVKGIKGGVKHTKDSLNRDQINDILTGIDSPRDQALFILMLTGGLRCVEIVRADYGDLQSKAGHPVLYVQGKGHDAKDDFIKLDNHTYKALLAYLKTRGPLQPTDPLFASDANRNKGLRLTTISISRILKTYFRKAGIDSPRVTAHSTRHSTAQICAEIGIDMRKTQAVMRHKNLGTTEIYFDEIEKLEDPTRDKLAAYLFPGQCSENLNS